MKKRIGYMLAGGLMAGMLVLGGTVANNVPVTSVASAEEHKTVINTETKQQLDDIIADNKYVAVDIGATWCGPCRDYSPTFEEVAEAYKGKVVFSKAVIDFSVCNGF